MANSSSASLVMNFSLPPEDFRPQDRYPYVSKVEVIGLDIYADVVGISLYQLYQYVKGKGMLAAEVEDELRQQVEEQAAAGGLFSGNIINNDAAAAAVDVEKKKKKKINVVVDHQDDEVEDSSSSSSDSSSWDAMDDHNKFSKSKLIKRPRMRKSKRNSLSTRMTILIFISILVFFIKCFWSR